jgi:hypothetical protein
LAAKRLCATLSAGSSAAAQASRFDQRAWLFHFKFNNREIYIGKIAAIQLQK